MARLFDLGGSPAPAVPINGGRVGLLVGLTVGFRTQLRTQLDANSCGNMERAGDLEARRKP